MVLFNEMDQTRMLKETGMSRSRNYEHKTHDYFQVTQETVADFISGQDKCVLEIGCGEGYTGAYLKKIGKAKEVHGVELVPEVAQAAQNRLDSVIIGDLEVIDLPFERGYFDYVIATETLEHLATPENVLKRIKPMLKQDGVIIASVPNVRHVRLLWHLVVQGDWLYQDAGLLDRTHLRFFTKKSLIRLFTVTGYDEIETVPILLSKAQFLNKVTFGIVEDFLAYRYYCISRNKKSET
jgi:2-polyprenyl-3-methyl-5-hydroxy-6-metoxy-1,4-benzoquinol methylase